MNLNPYDWITAAVEALKVRARGGDIKAIRALTDGTLQPPPGDELPTATPPPTGWGRCPSCGDPVFSWLSPKGQLHLSDVRDAADRLTTAPEWVQRYAEAIDAGVQWTEELDRFRAWERATVPERWRRFRIENGEPPK